MILIVVALIIFFALAARLLLGFARIVNSVLYVGDEKE
jgi:hypothetical protein